MKTIGLIGGMSWESTATYYRLINEGVKAELGGLHSAKMVLVSVDFAEIEALQMAGDWQKTGQILAQAAVSLQSAGADFFLICTNTMHKVAELIQAAVNIPLLHIADATGEALKQNAFTKVGLLGTAFTMEQSFYKDRLADKFGLSILVPNDASRNVVHNVIYDELCLGVINDLSREKLVGVIQELNMQGAQSVILGCTEISLLVSDADVTVPLLDTTQEHAKYAVTYSLSLNAHN